jgi:hypothetical protein
MSEYHAREHPHLEQSSRSLIEEISKSKNTGNNSGKTKAKRTSTNKAESGNTKKRSKK